MRYKFEELKEAPLIIDAIYEGGEAANFSAEPLHVLLPKMMNQKGIRPCLRKDINLPAYVVIFTTTDELEWPDHLFLEEGLFRYYGDNRRPGQDLNSTNGNKLFCRIFELLEQKDYSNIPPFLIFEKIKNSKDVKFLGIGIPGNQDAKNKDENLISIWKSKGNDRFQNYLAYFTLIDIKNEKISKNWLNELISNHDLAIENAPKFWRKFVETGLVDVLKPQRTSEIRSKKEQLPANEKDLKMLNKITEYYRKNPHGFEKCAANLIKLLDKNFYKIDVTRPWKDGGKDANGLYKIGSDDYSLDIDFALEAKCFNLNHGIGVRYTSRLISRIKHRQFGIFITTSYVDSQAYKEIKEDGHPIIIISGRDIVTILNQNSINLENVKDWLDNCNKN